ncbi:uncharacterized protein PHALS_07630 [Plasmopara halstedii]|uniref:Uncharacterized protein n=1 Tax=Plasmopara halstedii TaxID=4781 RepID=A0A0P1B707_PLAHL|nr:uncharacterized protein PHALS_07630 [Plasmopara halstedii]CEG49893.1 hypothetical protein PHALS_07630 [Plasmopara halstedii]|eukprot:XP_024586262.1 hypothetical protein PHALS_07630 [Plasmopara halstedii]
MLSDVVGCDDTALSDRAAKIQDPHDTNSTKKASHFLMKHHTNEIKTKTTQEIVSEMEATKEMANLQLLPDRLAAADAMVNSLQKALRAMNNPDTLKFMSSVKSPMALNTVLLRQMYTKLVARK